MPKPTDRAEVTKLANAVEDALAEAMPTSWRDDAPLPQFGPTPPVPQPGVPPMSQKTTETARAVMFCSLATVPPGLVAIGIMLASEHANPTIIGMICAAPAAIAVPILAIARLIRRAGEAAPTEIHQHYSGNIHQETVRTETRAVWAKTINKQ